MIRLLVDVLNNPLTHEELAQAIAAHQVVTMQAPDNPITIVGVIVGAREVHA